MNAKNHNPRCRWVAGLVIACVMATGTCLAAEKPTINPLRSTKVSVRDRTSPVQPAAAFTPVRQTPPVSGRRAARSTVSPVSTGISVPRHEPRGFVPRHQLMANTQWESESVEPLLPPVADEEFYLDELPAEGEFMDVKSAGMDSGYCGTDEYCGDCGDCGDCTGCLIPCPVFTFKYLEFFGGAQGFTGPTNRGETGSFGFHYGANWAAPVPCMPNRALGMQIGYRGVNTNYSGASFTDDTRNQTFLTAGLFRRVDWGLQGGVVVDYLRDEWYYDLNLTQLRGELSWVYTRPHELGFWFSTASKSDVVDSALLINGQMTTISEEYEATDLYAFFYRHRFQSLGGGYGRLYGGFTGKSDGLLGADFKIPLTVNWALQGGFTYLTPKDGNPRVAHAQEAWNVGVSIIWYPGSRKSIGNDYFRPLFDVADNGSFMIKGL